ncbi:MAG TPA: hypothetical protein VNC61_16240 [Acidimicrobiales bacterium]|nr:hypothetical protein [Acidimicrobiales bacterium]
MTPQGVKPTIGGHWQRLETERLEISWPRRLLLLVAGAALVILLGFALSLAMAR